MYRNQFNYRIEDTMDFPLDPNKAVLKNTTQNASHIEVNDSLLLLTHLWDKYLAPQTSILIQFLPVSGAITYGQAAGLVKIGTDTALVVPLRSIFRSLIFIFL